MDNNQIIRQPFGLNVALPKHTIQEVEQAARHELENFTVKPLVNFFSTNYNLSPEEISKDLRKAQSQIYTLGQVMREGQPGTTLNMKF